MYFYHQYPHCYYIYQYLGACVAKKSLEGRQIGCWQSSPSNYAALLTMDQTEQLLVSDQVQYPQVPHTTLQSCLSAHHTFLLHIRLKSPVVFCSCP